jgi:hypothetical protein
MLPRADSAPVAHEEQPSAALASAFAVVRIVTQEWKGSIVWEGR